MASTGAIYRGPPRDLQNGTLFARAFDLNRLEATGPAVPVIGDVMSDTNTGVAQFAVSDTGTLVYLAGESVTEGVDIQWLDRNGKASPLRTTHANWWNLRFAPDRRRLALQITDGTDDIWIYEWSRDVLTRVTGTPATTPSPYGLRTDTGSCSPPRARARRPTCIGNAPTKLGALRGSPPAATPSVQGRGI